MGLNLISVEAMIIIRNVMRGVCFCQTWRPCKCACTNRSMHMGMHTYTGPKEIVPKLKHVMKKLNNSLAILEEILNYFSYKEDCASNQASEWL